MVFHYKMFRANCVVILLDVLIELVSTVHVCNPHDFEFISLSPWRKHTRFLRLQEDSTIKICSKWKSNNLC